MGSKFCPGDPQDDARESFAVDASDGAEHPAVLRAVACGFAGVLGGGGSPEFFPWLLHEIAHFLSPHGAVEDVSVGLQKKEVFPGFAAETPRSSRQAVICLCGEMRPQPAARIGTFQPAGNDRFERFVQPVGNLPEDARLDVQVRFDAVGGDHAEFHAQVIGQFRHAEELFEVPARQRHAQPQAFVSLRAEAFDQLHCLFVRAGKPADLVVRRAQPVQADRQTHRRIDSEDFLHRRFDLFGEEGVGGNRNDRPRAALADFADELRKVVPQERLASGEVDRSQRSGQPAHVLRCEAVGRRRLPHIAHHATRVAAVRYGDYGVDGTKHTITVSTCGTLDNDEAEKMIAVLLKCYYHVIVHIKEIFLDRKTRVTIAQVAKRAGVSRMTISRVLSNDTRVRLETRSRILRIMNQMGYVPNPSARAMRSNRRLYTTRTSCFALVFGEDTQKADEFFCEVARGVESEAADLQLSALQVHWCRDLEHSWMRMQRLFSMDGLCGTVLVGQFGLQDIRAIQRITPRVVLVDCPIPSGACCAGVETDNRGGCRIALNHLHERGARRVVLLSGPENHYFTHAMESTAGEFRNRFDSLEIYHTDYSPRMGRETIKTLIRSRFPFDGVFGNDTLCLGAVRALKEEDKSIPSEVRVVGFDDIPADAYLTPSLTSVRVDKRKLGVQAVKFLVDMVENNATARDIRAIVNAKLVIRESS